VTQPVVPEELAELWEELRPAVLTQVAAVRAAVAALHEAPLPDAAREQARSDAHQLAGSLGSFGFDAAGRMARTLELRFKEGPASEEAPRLDALVRELGEQLESLPAQQPLAPREAATPVSSDEREAGAPAGADPHERAASPAHVDVALVEDDEVLAELALHALGARGWSVRWIADGAEALRQLGGAAPALTAGVVLLDWDLPSLSGLDVLRGLAADDLLERQPVVMLTGHVAPEQERVARELGACEHVAKPYTVARLVETVRARLG
jgi:CheY-like chemotaxis protein